MNKLAFFQLVKAGRQSSQTPQTGPNLNAISLNCAIILLLRKISHYAAILLSGIFERDTLQKRYNVASRGGRLRRFHPGAVKRPGFFVSAGRGVTREVAGF
jgi:hypothetical protein